MYQSDLSNISSIQIKKDSKVPVYLQISNSILNNIRNGKFRIGAKLPGTRTMAKELNVHRKTLQMALDELLAQGWLVIIPRKGTFITRNLPEFKPVKDFPTAVSSQYPGKTNFLVRENPSAPFPPSDFQQTGNFILTEGFPDIRIAPMQQLLREIRSIEKRGAFRKYFHYGDPQGTSYLRDVLSANIRNTRALPITSDHLIITKGAQMGLYLAAHVLIKPGDQVVVGDPGYRTATLTLQRAGGTINRIPVDDNGINLDALEDLCTRKSIRLVYVIPHHHHPTTVTLTPERRIRLLNLAEKFKFAIIEDDYDYDFHYYSSPIVPMASLDRNGNVIYIGTLTKTLVPALRIGFLVAPNNFIKEAVALRRSIDFQGDSIMEIAIAELYKNGVIASHIKKSVRLYRERRDYFCNLLRTKMNEYTSFTIPDGGLCVWTRFQKADLVEVTRKAAKKGLLMNDGTIYNTPFSTNATRLGFSSLNYKEQEEAVDILLDCIEH